MKAALGLNPKPAFRFSSAANSITLPRAKPRAMREHFVVSPIHCRQVDRAQRSRVQHCEDALKALDFGNSPLGVHSVPLSNMSMVIVKRSDQCKRLHPRIAPELHRNRILELGFSESRATISPELNPQWQRCQIPQRGDA